MTDEKKIRQAEWRRQYRLRNLEKLRAQDAARKRKPESRLQQRMKRRANPQPSRDAARRYRLKNLDEIRARDAEMHRRPESREKQRLRRLSDLASAHRKEREKYLRNPESFRRARKKYYEKIKAARPVKVKPTAEERAERAREYQRRWRAANADKVRIAARLRNRRFTKSPKGALKNRLRVRIANALKSQSANKATKSFEMIGCTPSELRDWIQSKFKPGMAWNNRHLWHIDHKRPCASFDLTDPEQQKACFHYTNLQPLWATENLKKWKRVSAESES